MIAVYYCEDSSPYTMMVAELADEPQEETIDFFMRLALDKYGEQYPRPTSEVLFIKNDRLVETRER